ncbi:MAG: HNH endonuclease [Flavobacteriales bacterium]|nr:MAG: HNH endonuclease [Flavobacteriales bacterium]
MKKEDYFKQSRAEGLPKRCPILEYCARRMFTMYFYGDYRQDDVVQALKGYLPKDFAEKAIGYFGEAPVWQAARDRKSGYFHGMCPEVNLFDHEHQLGGMEGTASCGGSWNYENGKREQRLEHKHFSECSEFSKHAYDTLPTRLGRSAESPLKPKRVSISKKLRFEILQRDKFTCQYCNRSKDDGVKLQVDHHIPVAEGGTDDISNLRAACEDCNQGKSNKIITPLL